MSIGPHGPNRRRYLELQIAALAREEQRLAAKGVDIAAPRRIKLRKMIAKLYRDLGQGNLLDGCADGAASGGDGDGGNSAAASGATVQTQDESK